MGAWTYVSTPSSLSFVPVNSEFIQIMVEISASANVSSVSVSYAASHATYFFSTKFKLEKNTSPAGAILTGSWTEPQQTKVVFGITDSNAVKWDDYVILEPDRLVSLSKMKNNLKIGIKMLSYDTTHSPQVDEFSIMFKDATGKIARLTA